MEKWGMQGESLGKLPGKKNLFSVYLQGKENQWEVQVKTLLLTPFVQQIWTPLCVNRCMTAIHFITSIPVRLSELNYILELILKTYIQHFSHLEFLIEVS